MRWQEDVVKGLLSARAAGVTDFAAAWRRATCSLQRPRDWVNTDSDLIPFSTWFRCACQREWEGQLHADYINLRALLDDETATSSRVRTQATSTERAIVIA